MQIPKELAANIIKRLEMIQPYKVVLTDADGIIIGASDTSRIGSHHRGASQRFHYATEGTPFSDQDFPEGQGAAIRVNNKLVGIIGLSGCNEGSLLFLEAAKTIVEMMLEQELQRKKQTLYQNGMDSALYALISDQNQGDTELYWFLTSQSIDIQEPRTLVMIDVVPNVGSPASNSPFYASWAQTMLDIASEIQNYFSYSKDFVLSNTRMGNFIVFFAQRSKDPVSSKRYLQETFRSFLEILRSKYPIKVRAVIGKTCSSLNCYSGQYQYLRNKLIAEKLCCPDLDISPNKPILAGEVVVHLPEEIRKSIVENVLGKLLSCRQRDMLMNTLTVFFANGMSMKDTAAALYIHRGTLQYRIQQLEEITGYNIHELDDLLLLRMAFLCYNQEKLAPTAT